MEHSIKFLLFSEETNLLSQGTSKISLNPWNYREMQLLQKLQQLPKIQESSIHTGLILKLLDWIKPQLFPFWKQFKKKERDR